MSLGEGVMGKGETLMDNANLHLPLPLTLSPFPLSRLHMGPASLSSSGSSSRPSGEGPGSSPDCVEPDPLSVSCRSSLQTFAPRFPGSLEHPFLVWDLAFFPPRLTSGPIQKLIQPPLRMRLQQYHRPLFPDLTREIQAAARGRV